MIINDDNVFFFANGDKYDLHENQITDLHKSDFSIYCRFKPNHNLIESKMGNDTVYNGGILVKNGKHFGIFFNVYKDGDTINYIISFEFWSFDEKLGKDVPHSIQFFYDKEDRYYDVMLNHDITKKEFTLTEGIEAKTIKYDNIIDYSDSYTWLGAANLISETHQSVFYGDIHKIHIQKSTMDEQYPVEFFNHYPTFLKHIEGYTDLHNVFSTDFSKLTYYKILDMSGNGFHPIKFKNEWIINDIESNEGEV